LKQTGKDNDAEEIFERLGASGNIQAIFQQIKSSYKKNNFEEALRIADGIIDEIKSPEIPQYIGQCYYQLGDYKTALEKFQEKIKNIKSDAEAHQYIGQCYYQLGDYKTALEKFQEKIKNIKSDAEAHQYIGQCYYQLGDYKTALEKYEEALKIKKNNIQSYNGIYNCYFIQQMFKEALLVVDRILSVGLKDVKLLKNGIFLCIDGKYKIFNLKKAREFLEILKTSNFKNKKETLEGLRGKIDSFELNRKKK